MRKCIIVSLCSGVLLALLSYPGCALGLSFYQPGTTGIDVSWPPANCSAQRPAGITFAIIGLNDGRDFTVNPCAVKEASQFGGRYSLYLNTGWPGKKPADAFPNYPRKCQLSDPGCLAYNYGYNDVLYSLRRADTHNLHTTNWWLDVETDNSWSSSPAVNQANLQGMVKALRQSAPFSTIG